MFFSYKMTKNVLTQKFCMISVWKWWNSPGVKKSWKDKPSALHSLSVTNLTFHASEAWTESNLFPSPAWKDTIINQLSNRGWGHAQAIKKVTARPACWRAEASPADGCSPSQKYKCRNYVTISSQISINQWICVISATRNHHKNKNPFFFVFFLNEVIIIVGHKVSLLFAWEKEKNMNLLQVYW